MPITAGCPTSSKQWLAKALMMKKSVVKLGVWESTVVFNFFDEDFSSKPEEAKIFGWIKRGTKENTWANICHKVDKLVSELEKNGSSNPAQAKLIKGNYFAEKSAIRNQLKELFSQQAGVTKDIMNIIILNRQSKPESAVKPLKEILVRQNENQELFNFILLECIIRTIIKLQQEIFYQEQKISSEKNSEFDTDQDLKSTLDSIFKNPETKKFVEAFVFQMSLIFSEVIQAQVLPDMVEGLTTYFEKTFVKIQANKMLYYTYLEANMFKRVDSYIFAYSKSTNAKFKETLAVKMKDLHLIAEAPKNDDQWKTNIFNNNFFLHNFCGFEAFIDFLDIFDLFSDVAFTKRGGKKEDSIFLKAYIDTFDSIYSMIATMRYNSADFGFNPLGHTWSILKDCVPVRLSNNLPYDAELPEERCPLSYSNLEDVFYIFLIYLASVDVSFETQYTEWIAAKMNFPAVDLTHLFSITVIDDYFKNQFENFCQVTTNKRTTGKQFHSLAPLTETDLFQVWTGRPICLALSFVTTTVEFLRVHYGEEELNGKDQKDPDLVKSEDNDGSFQDYEDEIEIILKFLSQTTTSFTYYTIIWSSIGAMYEIDMINEGFDSLMSRGLTNGFNEIKYNPSTNSRTRLLDLDVGVTKNFYRTIAMYPVGNQKFADHAREFIEYVRLRFVTRSLSHLDKGIQEGLEKLSSQGTPYWEIGGKPIYELVEIGVKYGYNNADSFTLLMKTVIEDCLWVSVLKMSTNGGSVGEAILLSHLNKFTEEINPDHIVAGIMAIIETKTAEFVMAIEEGGDESINPDSGQQKGPDLIHNAIELSFIKQLEEKPLTIVSQPGKDQPGIKQKIKDAETQSKEISQMTELQDGSVPVLLKSDQRLSEPDNSYDSNMKEILEIHQGKVPESSQKTVIKTNTQTPKTNPDYFSSNTYRSVTNFNLEVHTNTAFEFLTQKNHMGMSERITTNVFELGVQTNLVELNSNFGTQQTEDSIQKKLNLNIRYAEGDNLSSINDDIHQTDQRDLTFEEKRQLDFDHDRHLEEEPQKQALDLSQLHKYDQLMIMTPASFKALLAQMSQRINPAGDVVGKSNIDELVKEAIQGGRQIDLSEGNLNEISDMMKTNSIPMLVGKFDSDEKHCDVI